MKTKIIAVGLVCLALGVIGGMFIERQRQPKAGTTVSSAPIKIRTAERITVDNLEDELAKLLAATNSANPFEIAGFLQTRCTEFVSRLAPEAYPVAAQKALALPSRQTYVITTILQRWVAVDVEAARKFTLAQSGPLRKTCLALFISAWNQQSPDALMAWLEQTPTAEVAEVGLPILVQRLSTSDPTRAFGFWQKLPPPQRRIYATTVFRGLAEKEPTIAITNLTLFSFGDYEVRNLASSAFQTWISRDAEAAAAYLRQMPDGTRRREFIQSASTAFGRSHPKTGLQLIQSLPVGDDRQNSLRSLLYTWASQDTMSAFQYARELPEGGDRQAALNATLDKLGEINPDALKDFIMKETAHPAVVSRIGQLVRHLAGTNALDVIEWGRQLPAGTTRNSVLSQSIAALDESQTARALELTEELLTGETRRTTLKTIFNQWTARDPKAAGAAAAAFPSGAERGDILEAVAMRWTPIDPQAAMQWLLALEPNADRRRAERAVASALEQERPADAAEFVIKLPAAPQNSQLLESAIGRWAAADLNGAAAWLEKQPDDLRRRNAYRRLAQATMRTDIQRAAEFALKSPVEDGYGSVREEIANQWAENDPAQAAKWLLTHSNSNRLGYSLGAIVSKWSQKDPLAAITFISALPKDSPVFSRNQTAAEYLRTPLFNWSRENPAAAAGWLATNATAEIQSSASHSVFSQWAERDAAEMLTWLRAQPAGAAREKFASAAVQSLANSRPELAAQNVGLISDERQRQQTMQSIYYSWQRLDPKGANGWLSTNALPEATKDRLRNRKY